MKTILVALCLSLACCILPPRCLAQNDDPVLKANIDEMKRVMADLHPSHGSKPFYLSFTVNGTDDVVIAGSLGSLSKNSQHCAARCLTTVLKVGDYDVDSIEADQDKAHLQRDVLTIDDDYRSLRRQAWLGADEAYRQAVKTLETKRSWLKAHDIKNRLPDMSKEPPTESLEKIPALHVDEKKWQERVRQLSAIYRDFPTIDQSLVLFVSRVRARWYVNSDGTRIRDAVPECFVFTGAWTAPKDGITYWDCDTLYASSEDRLPDEEALKQWVKDFAEHCQQSGDAPLVEDYSGPILFEGQAGASFFSNLLGGNLGSDNFRSGDGGDQVQNSWNVFRNAAGRRILPRYITVVDDPSLKTFAGKELTGGWTYDDDGVKAEKVTLVDHGILKAFCTSRVPIKNQPQSNGHSVDGIGTNSILSVESSKTLSADELRKRLQQLGEDDSLDYVLIVRKIYSPAHINDLPNPWSPNSRPDETFTQGYISSPSQIYKLYLKDGHEQLVKGAVIKSYDTRRLLKDIEAVGDDAKPYLVERYDTHRPMHIVAPSVLLREIEIEKDDGKEKAHVVPSPLAQ